MTRLDFTGYADLQDSDYWDCIVAVNNVLAEFAEKSGGRYSLDPQGAEATPEEASA